MTQLAQIATRLRLSAAQDGWARTLSRAARKVLTPSHAGPDDFDLKRGTDTSGTIPLWREHIDSANAAHGVHYATADEMRIRALLDPLPRDATVVDLGCGKGRVLIVAAELGFRRVEGVEFVGRWCDIASVNLFHIGAHSWMITCADATQYRCPNGPLIVYLYDPFGPEVMAKVADNLKTHEGELWVVYVNPRCADLFGWMEPVALTSAQTALFSPGSVCVWRHS